MATDSPESISPGHPEYRRALDDGLLVRWSTPEDRAGITLTSSLALGLPEGFEAEFFVRIPERLASDDYWMGDSRGWAICVGTKGPRIFPCGRPLDEGVDQEETYIAETRKEASSAQEPVLAVVSYTLMEWRIEGHPVKACKHTIVACRPGFRMRDGGPQVMARLFEMIKTRMQETGVAFSAASGIPNYYRRHGYELATRYGPGFTTFACEASPDEDASITFREATTSDTGALVRLDRLNTNASPLCASVSDEVLEQEYQWSLGARGLGYQSISAHRHVPAYVLERADKIIAAWFYYAHPHVAQPEDCKIIVRRLIYDPDVSLPMLARAVVPRVIEASKRLVEEEVFALGLAAGGEEEAVRQAAKQAQLLPVSWHLSEDHPVMEHVQSERLARKDARGTSYLFSSDWWVAIPSLIVFASALDSVLQGRVAAAAATLGTSYKGNLRIATYSAAYPGLVITIDDGNLVIRSKTFSRDSIALAPRSGDEDSEIPNVIAPRGPLTQLLMGYLSLEDLRRTTPDLSVTDEAAPLLKVLFPPVTKSIMHTYAW